MQDLYGTLGVPRDATQDDIKKAFRKQAQRYHPDVVGASAGAAELFGAVAVRARRRADEASRAPRSGAGVAGGGGAERLETVGIIIAIVLIEH